MSRKNITILINKVARSSTGQLKQSVKTAYTNGNGIDKKGIILKLNISLFILSLIISNV